MIVNIFHFTDSIDPEQRNIIAKLANFVARNGPEFEEMTKNKQRGNPKFSFLFGGPQHDFYNRCVAEERASTCILILYING